MDYGQLISTAWRMTWRYRGLWVVGLFAGSASGSGGTFFNSGGGGTTGAESFGDAAPGLSDDQLSEVLAQVSQAVPVLIAVGVILLVIYLIFWLLSVACQSAVIAGAGEAATGADVTLGGAWSNGMKAFGRLAGLDLLWLVVWLVTISAVVAYAVSALGRTGLNASFLFGLFSVIALLGIIASVLSVVIAYAQRAIVLDGRGPIEGLASGFSLARTHLGTSVILWLIGLALSIGGGIALIIGLIVAAIPGLIVGGVLALIVNASGGPGVVPLIAAIGVTVLVAALVGGAALNTLLWHFWTLSYLRLTHPTAPLPPPPILSS